MNRHSRKTVAEETLRILERGEYAPRPGSRVFIVDAVVSAVEDVRLFTPEELADLLGAEPKQAAMQTRFKVRNETTLSAAARLVVELGLQDVLCLNFASAKNPGGGFLVGSQAQEESLARSSALYATLTAAPAYYDANRRCGTAFYTDHMILSPNVLVFREDSGALLDRPYNVSFLTAPAVNAGAVRKNEPRRVSEINETMRRRIAMALTVAEHQGYRRLVLGAWGCGVFRNDPAEIAALFAEQLAGGGRYSASFDAVVFAVLDKPNGGIFEVFQKTFEIHETCKI